MAMLKAEQSGPITEPLWNGARQQKNFAKRFVLVLFQVIIQSLVNFAVGYKYTKSSFSKGNARGGWGMRGL